MRQWERAREPDSWQVKNAGIRGMVQTEHAQGQTGSLSDREPSLSTESNSGEPAAWGKWAA